jgi:hypothetical protein
MKESITKFDIEAAFKALDEIETPITKGVKANKPALTEIFSRKSKFDSLFEEYYDVTDSAELDDAKEAREAEIAKAKLDRIEKIVDLDAESPEDLLTSYVGKYIIQCPQCMTLFYKNPEDVVEAENDPDTVNLSEICQHCGNESGYTLVGKVGEATPEEDAGELDLAAEEIPEAEEAPAEEGAEDSDLELDDLGDLDELDLNLEEEEPEEEKTEESFTAHEGEPLVEELSDDADLDAKLEAHNEYIEYLRAAISQEEEKLEKATNEQVKVSIQRNIDAFKVDLENALPDAVKNDTALPEETAEEATIEDAPAEEAPIEIEEEPVVQEESYIPTEVDKTLTEELHEATDLDVSADEFEELINSPEFKKPISDTATRAMLNAEKESEEENVEESIAEEANEVLEEGVFDKIKDKFAGAKDKFTKFLDNQLKSRASAADWLLKSAMIDYAKAAVKDNGEVETAQENRKFANFIVIGYNDTGKNKQKITAAPKHNSANLVVGMKYPEVKQNYADAENVAKGWSMVDGNGPAFIYLAKNAKGEGAAFLCQYFKGQLDATSDQLENYVAKVRNSITGGKLQAKGGTDQSDTRNIKASEVKPGMKAKFKKGVAEITEIADSDIRDGYKSISVKFEDGSARAIEFSINDELAIMRNSAQNECLDTFMAGLEELQESALENQITKSLSEACGNVESFKITECTYLNEKLSVDGEVTFKTGDTEKTTYVFTEAFMNDSQIELHGNNERLNKKVIVSGRIDNKTFITESIN